MNTNEANSNGVFYLTALYIEEKVSELEDFLSESLEEALEQYEQVACSSGDSYRYHVGLLFAHLNKCKTIHNKISVLSEVLSEFNEKEEEHEGQASNQDS